MCASALFDSGESGGKGLGTETLAEARTGLLSLIRERSHVVEASLIESAGNERIAAAIQDYSDLVLRAWPGRSSAFTENLKTAREGFSEINGTINGKFDKLVARVNAEIKLFSDDKLLNRDPDKRKSISKIKSKVFAIEGEYRTSVMSFEKTSKIPDIAPASSADAISVFHVLQSPRFSAFWYWIGLGACLLGWTTVSFGFGVVLALLGICGFAFMLYSQAQSYWKGLAILRNNKDFAIESARSEIAAIEKQIALGEQQARKEVAEFGAAKRLEISKHEVARSRELAAARAAFDAECAALVQEWGAIRQNLSFELKSLHLELEEGLFESATRLDQFAAGDPVRDQVSDLATQLKFRIGAYDPTPPQPLPDEPVRFLGLDPTPPRLGARFPVMYSLLDRRALLIHADNKPANTASITVMDNVLTRILRQVPPGKATFTLFDPLGLGSNFAPYLKLQEYSDKLIDGAVWTSRDQIKRQLENIITHLEGVNKLYLKADYPDIEAFNQDAKEIREPYRFLVIADFPEGFDEESLRDLVRIVQNGPRCGVHTIIYWNKTGKEFYGFDPAELAKFATHLRESANGSVSLQWTDEVGINRNQSFHLDPPPPRDYIKAVVDKFGSDAADAMTVEVPFDRLYDLSGYGQDWWKLSSAKDISVPVGPIGASDALRFRFDSRLSNNALVVGRPGSGKSNLMHVFISMVAHQYSPDEVELYLIDFKKGVEFKDYAKAGLPHARVIAVESEREFGLSVLEALDKEMLRRSEVFKAADGVEGLAQYREMYPDAKMPRCVLLIDEFQEMFSREDKIKDEASILLDRIVRQGRSFGVHVILGTQSLHNSGLMRSTSDQIPIRIALQCSEADSRAILADDNIEARSLSRPGEAIYNDMGGLVEGNKRFQVALFGNQDRKALLKRLSSALPSLSWHGRRPRIFEGHEPASLADCEAIFRYVPGIAGAAVPLWIGEPVSLDPPISLDLSVQAGRNLLVVARDEQASVHLILSAIASLTARLTPRDLRVQIIDLSTADAAWADDPECLEKAFKGRHRIEVGGKLDLKHVLPELCATLDQRKQSGDGMADGPREVLAIIGAHRARNLRRSLDTMSFAMGDDEIDAAPGDAEMLARLAEEGPEHGIHSMLWVDSLASFEKIFSHSGLEHFALRMAGPLPDRDSHTLFESNAASAIDKPNRMIAYDDDYVGVLRLFRPYKIPGEEFFDELVKQRLATTE